MILIELKNSKEFSENFKTAFLLEFTRELIKNSATKEIVELEKTLKEEQKKEAVTEKKTQKKEIIKNKPKKIEKKLPPLTKKKINISKKITLPAPIIPTIHKPQAPPIKIPKFKPLPTTPKIRPPQPRLKIPETRFPPRLQYLQPIPTNFELNLGKINPLIKDPLVETIECSGQGQNLVVTGKMGTKKTKIILTKEEIQNIIQRFSTATKIPVSEGIYKVVRGKLILSSIVSEIVGSKFIIKKIRFSQPQRGVLPSPRFPMPYPAPRRF
ncbi:MAG: hypothetical protein KKF48_00470 [Nanoarchaeota archaeon]|nr:hypothetical protein [Nanoarchaeota archaeon]MBU1027499.1 hypothetical protein [Nanoarchaeota archaeon]